MAKFGRTGLGGVSAGRRSLGVALCVSVALLALYQGEGATGPIHTLRSAVGVVETPFNWLGSQLARPFDVLGRIVVNAAADEETLDDLTRRNAELTAQVAELNEYRLENENLRSLLGMAGTYGTQGLGARVIGVSSDDWSATITIDRGSDDGVSVDMPVTDGHGVVGQVTEVSKSSATVCLVSDSESEVSVTLQSSRAAGVLRGSVDGSLHLDYVEAGTSVSVGELVVTSGLGGVYPKGLLVGTVASVSSSPSDVYLSIVVTPIARTGNYEEVYVVISYDADRAADAAEALLTGVSTDSGAPADSGTSPDAESSTPADDAAGDMAAEGASDEDASADTTQEG